MPTAGVVGQQAQYSHEGITRGEVTGGVKKIQYWTPDGREMWAVPSLRGYRRILNKKVIGEGIRDANLDKGWLLRPPAELKPYCPHCDKWHDTQKEINACRVNRKAFDEKYMKKAKKEVGSSEVAELRAEVTGIKSDMSDIKDMLTQLLAKKE